VKIGEVTLKALVDSGSSSSFIDEKLAQSLKFQVFPLSLCVSMASSNQSISTCGSCIVDVSVQLRLYPKIKLTLMPNLCTDIILGLDFMSLHKSVAFDLKGIIDPLVICNAAAMSVEPPSLFPKFNSDCRPISIPSRHFNFDDREFIAQETASLLKEGIIEPSVSPWRAQVVVTKSNNHRKRLVIDYSQTVNRYTQHDAYPLPLIEDLVHQVSQYKLFSVLDLKSAYHQIPLKEKEKFLTAFEANGQLYQFTRMPFGLTNAVAAFQRIMNSLINSHKLIGVFSYLDDIIIAGKTKEEHDENLNKFMEVTKSINISLNTDKCILCKETINFLGYSIGQGKVKPDANRLEPLRNLPVPQDLVSLRRVIGLFAYYSKWIPKFSDKIVPLTTSSFPLNDEAIKCFQEIKAEIEKAALFHIDEKLPFVVETDASDNAIAATLNQNGRPVAFYSRKLSDTERKYPSIEKEAYAIVEALRKWRHFLLIRPFSLITDQQGVSFMFGKSKLGKIKNSKIQRWRIELSPFQFDIRYRPGKENIPADTLTRVCGATNSKISLKQIHNSLCHPGVRRLYHYIKTKNLPYTLDEVRKTCSDCIHCLELKPRFLKTPHCSLVRATRPFERISIDFMGPKPTVSNNRYILTIVDEYSRFPFAFPCRDTNADTVIRCLETLFNLFGTPESIHSDRGSQFMSETVTNYCQKKNIAQTRTSPYNPQGNGQCEKYNGLIWKSVLLTTKSQSLKDSQWEQVLPEVLNSIRSLLCTATNSTPHERLFNYSRKSALGSSIPSWLLEAKTVLIRRHVRTNKNDPLTDRAEIVQVNPHNAIVRFENGRETSVSLRDIAPFSNQESCPDEDPPSENQEIDCFPELRKSGRLIRPPARMNL
jgi:transposase InsO family protein